VLSVQRLSARALLDDSPEALAHARAQAAAGDESWQQWVGEYQRGEALILRLELTLSYSDGEARELRSSSGGLFVETAVHPAKLEQQIAELASGDFVELAEQLVALGHQIDAYELGNMYVRVELDEDLLRSLQTAGHSVSSGPDTEA
jgi:hypothetical protein